MTCFGYFVAESVSRMIADLPPKRVTRRLVFEAPNGNSQATINSVSMIQVINHFRFHRNIYNHNSIYP